MKRGKRTGTSGSRTEKNPGFIFELKYARSTGENFDTLAEKALLQIDEKRYDSDMTALGVEKIIKIGIAFSGKKAVVKRTK